MCPTFADEKHAVSFTGNDRDLGNGCLSKGIKKLCSRFDDSSMFLTDSRKKARDIFEDHQGQVKGIAEADKASRLDRRIDIQGSGEKCGLIGDNPQRESVQSSESDHDVFGELRLYLKNRCSSTTDPMSSFMS